MTKSKGMRPRPNGWVMHWKRAQFGGECYVYVAMLDGMLCYESNVVLGDPPEWYPYQEMTDFTNEQYAHEPSPECTTVVPQ